MANEYSSKAQLLIELGNHATNLLANLTDEQILAIIEKQSRILDDMLQSVKTVPFAADAIPDIVEELCLVLVTYKLWKRYSFKDVPENIRKDYELAFKTIEKIQNGKITIGCAEDFSDEEDEIEADGLTGGATDKLRWQAKPKTFTSDLD